MRDLSRESNGTSWPPCFGENNLANGQFYYGFLPRTVADTHSGYDKDLVKQTMLEHEATFKNQVYELHRLYQVQRDLMDEVRRKEQYEQRTPYEASSSSSPVLSQMKSEDVRRWNGSSHPLANSVYGRPTSGPDAVQSSPQSVKGKSIQASPGSFQNGHSPRNSEVSESRPTKLRRMLDLQLPADEYIDPDEAEEVGDSKAFENVGPFHDKNGKVAPPENGKLFLHHHGVRTECSSRLDSHVSKAKKALADLNEPIYVEENTADSSANFASRVGGHNDVRHWDLPTKSSIGSRDVAHNSIHGNNSIHGSVNGEYLRNYHLQNRPSAQDSFRYALESEQQKSSLRFINQGIHTEKGSKPMHPVNVLLDPASQQPPVFASVGDHFRGDPWKAKSLSNYNKPEPTMSSHFQNQASLYNSADLSKPWDQCGSSWGKPSGGLTQHSTPTQVPGPFLASGHLSKSPLQSSTQSNGFFGGKWNLNCTPGVNGTFEGESYPKNGFYQGASNACFREVSAPITIPQVGFDSGKNLFKGAASIDVKPMKDVNLNVALQDDALQDQKPEDPLAVLPWLRGKGAHVNKAETSNNVLQSPPQSKKPESCRRILGVPIFENLPTTPKKESTTLIDLSVPENRSAKEEAGPSGRKLVFDMNAPCELSDSELEKTDVEQQEQEEVGVVEKKTQTESRSVRNHFFDLNSCITEEEIPIPILCPPPPHAPPKKVDTGIDLEAPIVLEDEDDPFLVPREEEQSPPTPKEPEKLPEVSPTADNDREEKEEEASEQLAKLAAEAIIAISSVVPQEPPIQIIQIPEDEEEEDPLHWFVSIACSSSYEDHPPKELDDFESMTLRLKSCTFEEYFPKPSVPEFPNMDQAQSGARLVPTRARKGQARRGRQRRDFQRDILPGLTSLSRHEVTEDMQTFGGLMRATGYNNWQCGPNRRNATRNGSGRGRRRAVQVPVTPPPGSPPAPVHTVSVSSTKQQQQQLQQQQLQMSSNNINNNTEGGLEDNRSLTGWGKTTRRPRRQRLPAGNLTPPVPLS